MTKHDFSVLIVDKDASSNSLVEDFFSDRNIQVERANSIKEGEEKLISFRHDLILMDYVMDDSIGLKLLEFIRTENISVPIIIIAEQEEQEVFLEFLEKGADDYLLKPLNLELFWLKIQRLLNAYELKEKEAQQNLMVQALLDEQDQEEELAKYVYEHMINHDSTHIKSVNSLLKSSTSFNGDALIVKEAPTGNLFVMLMDASGHGLAAAISILPLVSIFTTMVDKGLELSTIIFELNQKLSIQIPDDRFVAAIVIEVDQENQNLNVWNGGMPEALIVDDIGKIIETCQSTNLPLSILEPVDFDADIQTFDVSSGGHFVFYSDGIVEQENGKNMPFGKERIKRILESSESHKHFIPNIEREFTAFVGDENQSDDASICHVEIEPLLRPDENVCVLDDPLHGQSTITMDLQGAQIDDFDFMQCLETFMRQTHMSLPLRQKSFTVCAELIVNAIEHGVLGLDSALKTQENGFLHYLELKEQGMQTLNDDDVIKLSLKYDVEEQFVEFQLSDSGPGFDQGLYQSSAQSSLHGRGLSLISRMSHSISYSESNNQTSVIIK